MKYYKLRYYKFQVADPSTLELVNDMPEVDFEWFHTDNDKIVIKEGYAWDGASGPVINDKKTIKASLIHDCFYQAMRLGLIDIKYRKLADEELRDQLIKAGCCKLRAYTWYIAVRLFGAGSAKKGNLQGKDVKLTD